MLGWMRKQTRSWFVYIAFGIIIIVFVFFYGWGGRGQRKPKSVASVNDQKITRRMYDEAYENLLVLSRNFYKRGFSEEEIKELRQRALDELIDRALMIQEAGRLGLTVGSDEIKKEISNTPAFQTRGKFNKDTYLRQLAASRMTPSEFEKAMEANMLISKLINIVQDTAKLSDKELFTLYRLENEKVNLKFLKLSALDLENRVEVSREEIEEHYKNTKESHRTPVMLKTRHLSFDPKLYREKVEIRPEEIEAFYRVNEDRFIKEEKVRAGHILLEVKGNEDGKREEEARKKAEEIRGRIEKGEDFSQLAKRFSQDTASASKGGDLGYFERGQMVKDFEEAAFSLKTGEVSPVVRTPRGFHIIKVKDVQERRTEPLEEVKSVIEEELRTEGADELAREEARRAIAQIYRSGDLVGYAKRNGLAVHETDFFSEGKPIEGIGVNKDFSDSALLLKAGEISPIVSVGKRYLVLQLIERKEPYLPTLEEVEEKVVKLVRKEKAREVAREEAEKLLREFASGASMDQIAKREHLTVEETGLFSRRSGFISKIGVSEELVREAFSLTLKKPLPQKVYGVGNRYYIVELEEREEADQGKFQPQKGKMLERFLAQKREERVKLWLKGLKERAEIKIFLTI
jgi:peptidyl-prolyl cis-trans isomerase D